MVDTACTRCFCCCSACHCLFAMFALCSVHVYMCVCVYVSGCLCVCDVYCVQRRLVLRGCLRKYLQQLIAKSAAMPTHQLPAPYSPRPQPSRLAALCPSALPQHKALATTRATSPQKQVHPSLSLCSHFRIRCRVLASRTSAKWCMHLRHV